MSRKIHMHLIRTLPLVSFFFIIMMVPIMKSFHLNIDSGWGLILFMLAFGPIAITISYFGLFFKQMKIALNDDNVLAPFFNTFITNDKKQENYPNISLHENKKSFSVGKFTFSFSFPSLDFKIEHKKSENDTTIFLTQGFDVVVIDTVKREAKYLEVNKKELTNAEFTSQYSEVLEKLRNYQPLLAKKVLNEDLTLVEEVTCKVSSTERTLNKEKVKSKV